MKLVTAPGHEGSHDVPQNIAWLSALKHAQKAVFMYGQSISIQRLADLMRYVAKRRRLTPRRSSQQYWMRSAAGWK